MSKTCGFVSCEFFRIGKAVAVDVGQHGIRPGGDFVRIGKAVAVGVRGRRIRADPEPVAESRAGSRNRRRRIVGPRKDVPRARKREVPAVPVLEPDDRRRGESALRDFAVVHQERVLHGRGQDHLEPDASGGLRIRTEPARGRAGNQEAPVFDDGGAVRFEQEQRGIPVGFQVAPERREGEVRGILLPIQERLRIGQGVRRHVVRAEKEEDAVGVDGDAAVHDAVGRDGMEERHGEDRVVDAGGESGEEVRRAGRVVPGVWFGGQPSDLVQVGESVAVRVRHGRIGAGRGFLSVWKAVAVRVDRIRRRAVHEKLGGVEEAVAVGVVAGAEAEEAGFARDAVRRTGPEGVGVDGDAVEGREDDVRERDARRVVDVLGRLDVPRKVRADDGKRDGIRRGGVRGEERPARGKVRRAVEVEDRFGERLVRRPCGGEEEVRFGVGEGGEAEVGRGIAGPADDERRATGGESLRVPCGSRARVKVRGGKKPPFACEAEGRIELLRVGVEGRAEGGDPVPRERGDGNDRPEHGSVRVGELVAARFRRNAERDRLADAFLERNRPGLVDEGDGVGVAGGIGHASRESRARAFDQPALHLRRHLVR